MMFFGYDNEDQLRAKFPEQAESIIQRSTSEAITVSNRSKNCTGSIDGKTFQYSDGSTDQGETATAHTSRFEGAVFKWTKEEPTNGH